MDDIALARVLHILAVVHWIGGVSFVTLVLIPAIRKFAIPEDRAEMFERIEHAFGAQAKVSVTVAGLSGLYMTYRLDAWQRFADPGYWWMHVMVLVWALFTFVLFVAEPLFLHRWFSDKARAAPEATFRLAHEGHILLLTLSAVAVIGGLLGAHGILW